MKNRGEPRVALQGKGQAESPEETQPKAGLQNFRHRNGLGHHQTAAEGNTSHTVPLGPIKFKVNMLMLSHAGQMNWIDPWKVTTLAVGDRRRA